jgi:hypothetical protein
MMDEPWPLLRDLSVALLLLMLAGVTLAPWALRWPPAAAAVTQRVNPSVNQSVTPSTDHTASRAAVPVPARAVTGTATG